MLQIFADSKEFLLHFFALTSIKQVFHLKKCKNIERERNLFAQIFLHSSTSFFFMKIK